MQFLPPTGIVSSFSLRFLGFGTFTPATDIQTCLLCLTHTTLQRQIKKESLFQSSLVGNWNQRYISTAKLQQTSNLQLEICKTLLSVLLLPSLCFRQAIIFGFCNRWLRARKLNKPSRQPGLFVSNRLLSAIFPAKAIIIVEEGKSLRILIYQDLDTIEGSVLQTLIVLNFSKDEMHQLNAIFH